MPNLRPINPLQEPFILTDLFYPGLLLNNICGKITYPKEIPSKVLQIAINQIIKNNDALRVSFIEKNGKYFQQTNSFSGKEILVYDLKNENPSNEKVFFEEFGKLKINVFDEVLFKIIIVKLKGEQTSVYIKTHHIISDSAAGFIFEKQLSELLEINSNLKLNPNGSHRYSYKDFLTSYKDYLGSIRYKTDSNYWSKVVNKYAKGKATLHSNKKQLLNSKRKLITLSYTDTETITNFCQENQVSILSLCMSLISVYAYKAVGKKQIVLNTPSVNRRNSDEKNTFGLFINTLPFLIGVNSKNSISQHIKETVSAFREFLKRSKFPSQHISRLSAPQNTLSNPHNVFISYENATVTRDNKIEYYFGNQEISPISIHIQHRNNSKNLIFEIDYQKDRYTNSQINNIFRRLAFLFNSAKSNDSIKIEELPILSPQDEFQLKRQRGSKHPSLKRQTLHSLFAETVASNGSGIAIIYGDRKVSFNKLDQQSDWVCGNLKELKLHKKEIATIYATKSDELIAVILGCMKAGIPFSSLASSENPAQIINYMKVSRSEILITNIENFSKSFQQRVVSFNELLEECETVTPPSISVSQVIYRLQTSGTTGKPKTVSVTHENINPLFHFFEKQYSLNSSSRLLQLASFGFDVFMGDIIKCFKSGLSLVIPSEQNIFESSTLYKEIETKNITVFESVPQVIFPLLQYVLKNKLNFTELKTVIFGADTCLTSTAEELLPQFPDITFFNTYGLTELSIESTSYKIDNNLSFTNKTIPIGKAINETEIIIVNIDFQEVPLGEEGQVLIGGTPLANFNDSKTKQASFFTIGSKLYYKTGDRGIRLQDGNILFCGRTDRQVKLNGVRVDLTRIENVAIKNIAVANAVVIYTKGNLALLATKQSEISKDELFGYLEKELPNNQLPKNLYFIDTIPLSKHGKVNYLELENIANIKSQSQIFKKPNSGIQQIISDCVREYIQLEISADTSFFQAGLDSLQVLHLCKSLELKGITISPQNIYNHNSIIQLETHIKQQQSNDLEYADFSIKLPLANLTSPSVILLTGATGFLGIHILKELLKQKKKVYCFVRTKNNESSEKRLKNIFSHYFNQELPAEVGVISDLSLLENDIYNKIDTVIHSAANVNFFGYSADFKIDNEELTEQVCNICLKKKIRLAYISTTGVTHHYSSLYQENYYIRSKKNAEKLVEQFGKKGVKAQIFRVGNLSGRESDGKFQINANNNIAFSMFKSLLESKNLSTNFSPFHIDFTPVDVCAEAVILLLNELTPKVHLFTLHRPKFSTLRLVELLYELGIIIKISKEEESEYSSKNIYNHSTKDLSESYKVTNLILKKNNFHWPVINSDYIKRILPR